MVANSPFESPEHEADWHRDLEQHARYSSEAHMRCPVCEAAWDGECRPDICQAAEADCIKCGLVSSIMADLKPCGDPECPWLVLSEAPLFEERK